MSLAGQISLLATRIGQEIKSVRSVMLQSLAVGTVTTGAAGSNASATITGTAPTQTLSFTIPQGIQGTAGVNAVTTSTSTTSVTIGVGSFTFTTATALTVPVGQTMRVWQTGTPANYMVGQVTAISGTSVTINVTETGGSGTIASWTLAIGAFQGSASAGGTSGANYTLTQEYTTTLPASPATGVGIFAKARGRNVLAYVNPQGEDMSVQSHMAFNRVCRWTAINNNALPVGDGMAVVANTGAAAVASATTNFFSSLSRVAYPVASTTTAASLAGFRGSQAQWFLSSTANMGGFYFVCRVGVATSAAGSRGFVGFSTTTSSLAAGSDPSTLLNQIGFGIDAASTNWYFIASGATAGTKVDLGANFPCKTSGTDFFEFSLYSPSGGGSKVLWSARRLSDGAVASGSNTTTLPALSSLMVPQVFYTNGTTAANAVLHFQSLYIESDN